MNPETIYSAGSGDWTQARLITVWGSALMHCASEPHRQVRPTFAKFSACLSQLVTRSS